MSAPTARTARIRCAGLDLMRLPWSGRHLPLLDKTPMNGLAFRIFSAVFLLCMSLTLPCGSTHAQVNVPAQAEEPAEASQEPEFPPDPLGRRTPRGTVLGYIEAVAEEDYGKAAEYLDLSYLPQSQRARRGAEIARALQVLLDRRGNVQAGPLLSDQPEGRPDDSLGLEQDRIGAIKIDDETIPVTVTRTEGEDRAPLWLFSADTLKQIPRDVEGKAKVPLEPVLPEELSEKKWSGVPIAHWLAMVLLIVASYLVAWLITASVTFLIRLAWRKARGRREAKLIKAFALPIRLYMAVWIVVLSGQQLGIPIIVRQYFSEATVVVAWVAILILVWRLIDVSAMLGEQRMHRKNNAGGLSAVLFFRRGGKFLLVAVGIITVLDTMGLEVTTWLAALGIGGLALALGAQKTVENFVGSLTVIFDQPIRVGDFCKVGETLGTIENIGMRSTRIRTLQRTLVTIPNGDFSAQRIENYAYRDRFLFRTTLGLRYETSPDQIRYLLVELRTLLYSHPRVDPDPARVRFLGFGPDSLQMEIFAYLQTLDYDDFLEIQEDLYLRIIDIVDASGSGFAFPSRTLYMAQDQGLATENGERAEAQVKEWLDKGELPLPRFDAERIERLRNSIHYPPEGSSAFPKDSDLK